MNTQIILNFNTMDDDVALVIRDALVDYVRRTTSTVTLRSGIVVQQPDRVGKTKVSTSPKDKPYRPAPVSLPASNGARLLNPEQVQVGDGVTEYLPSDCYPLTVTWVSSSGKTIRVRRDDFKRTDKNGLSEDQSYEFFARPGGSEQEARWSTKYNGYVISGTKRRLGTGRRAYQSPSV